MTHIHEIDLGLTSNDLNQEKIMDTTSLQIYFSMIIKIQIKSLQNLAIGIIGKVHSKHLRIPWTVHRGLNWTIHTTETGRSYIELDRSKDKKLTAQRNETGRSKSIKLRPYKSKDRPV